MKSNPPKLASKLLNLFAGNADLEDIQGDLDEVYEDKLNTRGKLLTDCWYWNQVFMLLFSYAFRKRKSLSSYSPFYSGNSIAMFENYLKIAIRNFSKHKLFTSLNILGLALGMSICLLALSLSVAIYRSDEYHDKKERIYQINTYVANEDQDKTYGSTFHALGFQLQEKYPFIEEIIKIKSGFSPEINHQGNLMNFKGYYADGSFFDAFSFELISGNPSTVLRDPFSIVLTQSTAETLYKNEDPIGKLLETSQGTFKVTGVMKDLKQTHFYFELLTSFSTYQQLVSNQDLKNDWVNFRDNYVYILLKEGTSHETLKEALAQLSEETTQLRSDEKIIYESIRLDHVVPRWNISNALGIGWDEPSMLFFMFIGLLILLPAIFNYTNLSIARALKRAKEIGIRKVVGAEKNQIKAQFIIETIILTFLALAVSTFFFIPMKNEFMSMVRAAEVLDTSMGFSQVLAFSLFALLIGIIAGIFPAKFFAKLNPVHTMKGVSNNGKINVSGFKKGLFVFQFFVSLVFIIGVGTILRQYAYVLNTNHGFESDNILVVPFQGINKQLVINELGNHKDVKAITTVSSIPGIPVSDVVEATPNDIDTLQVQEVFIGNDFLQNMNMKLKWGQASSILNSNLNEEMVIVNSEFLRSSSVFNIQKDSTTFTLMDGKKCKIIGVLEDIHYEPLSELVDPLIFRYSLDESKYALLTLNSSNIKKTINELDAIWSNIDQKVKFEATFLNDEIEDAYYFLTVQIKFFTFLSALAITISCLGLLGMVSYTTENRTKEIAVRKILGATNNSLYYLLTKDFVKLILISALIAIPFSYLFYDKLFLYFLIRYGLGLGPLEVVGGVLFLFIVGFVSIYWQTSRVARANPAGNLRYE